MGGVDDVRENALFNFVIVHHGDVTPVKKKKTS